MSQHLMVVCISWLSIMFVGKAKVSLVHTNLCCQNHQAVIGYRDVLVMLLLISLRILMMGEIQITTLLGRFILQGLSEG